jgi:hypothetical protein
MALNWLESIGQCQIPLSTDTLYWQLPAIVRVLDLADLVPSQMLYMERARDRGDCVPPACLKQVICDGFKHVRCEDVHEGSMTVYALLLSMCDCPIETGFGWRGIPQRSEMYLGHSVPGSETRPHERAEARWMADAWPTLRILDVDRRPPVDFASDIGGTSKVTMRINRKMKDAACEGTVPFPHCIGLS